MKRKVIAALGTATALVLTGCSSGSGSGSAKSGSGGTVTVHMVESLTNPTRTALLKTLIGQFEKANPTIKVDLISPPTDTADQKIQQMLQAGSGVDVLEVRDTTVGPFSTNGWLHDMGPDLAGWDGWSAMTDNAVKASKYVKGKTYFVPYGFYGLSLFYRTDLISQAGFSGPPASWDDLLKQASALQNTGKHQYGYAFRGGTNGSANAVQAIESYIADRVDPADAFKTTDGKTIFAAPEAQTALDTYFKLFKQASPPSSISWGYPEMVQGFSNGSTGFLLQDPEVIETVGQSKAITKEQWSTAPLPVGPTGKTVQPLATAGWGVAAKSSHPAEAEKLIEFLSTGEASTTFDKQNSLVPILKAAADDEFYKTGAWASYVTMTSQPDKYLVVSQPRDVAWWTEWQHKADADVQKVLLGQMTTQQLLSGWDAYWTGKAAGK
ncbi:sugar ABC transporter substrate-binding protein [Catenulispora subtropica]|uniref:Sugar ABC transporter substrate-binding protein n=1 Tax=Catenulispora subtropica TaxID=450798 RepID=A0ABP5DYN4_9ACTN